MWNWILLVAGLVIAYEGIRHFVVKFVVHSYEKRVDRFLQANRIPSDNFRHTHRLVVRERVLRDNQLNDQILVRAKEADTDVEQVRKQVRLWLDEILPQFRLLAYYQVGYALGRTIAYTMYHVDLDSKKLRDIQAKIPENACVVYVSNHRSNADFVVTGFMLSKSVQISYAVGEWARVWPLEGLFKSFGSYFVRRGEKDPLYHDTLRAYIQLITKEGLTQAMFPEGSLSRDGALRVPKLGLLDSMTAAKVDPNFTRPLVFVPVGINFDRVIEDENMVRESRGEGRPRRTLGEKAWRLVTLPWKVFVGLPTNGIRFMLGRVKKHGVCAIDFGEPISFDDWAAENDYDPSVSDRTERLSKLGEFGDKLMAGIHQVIPVTPVPLVCAALGEIESMSRDALLSQMQEVLDQARARHTPISLRDPILLKREARGVAQRDLGDLEETLDADIDLGSVLRRALEVLEKRKIVILKDGLIHVGNQELVRYYARSLDPPIRS